MDASRRECFRSPANGQPISDHKPHKLGITGQMVQVLHIQSVIWTLHPKGHTALGVSSTRGSYAVTGNNRRRWRARDGTDGKYLQRYTGCMTLAG
jgi:hypothetical protein